VITSVNSESWWGGLMVVWLEIDTLINSKGGTKSRGGNWGNSVGGRRGIESVGFWGHCV
jgi:hypothetical protein